MAMPKIQRTERSLLPVHGGYRHLKGFQIAQLAFDVTVRFVAGTALWAPVSSHPSVALQGHASGTTISALPRSV